jgi:predicted N-acetyltransferase YhbS
MTIRFRKATSRDYETTRQVVDAAFKPEDVATFLDALRDDGCALVERLAEDDSGVPGHL